MSVHYKFKSVSKKWGTVNFDSAMISLHDLKKGIVAQEKTDPKSRDFDFIITNAQTHERYNNDNYLIPKNTSVEVRRVPAMHASNVRIMQTPDVLKTTEPDDSISPVASADETADVLSDPSVVQPRVLSERVCQRCRKSGHLENNCVMSVMSEPVAGNAGSLPPKLACKLCRSLFTEPCVTPCCFTTYCSPCIRQALLSTSRLSCPFCNQSGIEPESLKPNTGIKKALKEYLANQQKSTRSDVEMNSAVSGTVPIANDPQHIGISSPQVTKLVNTSRCRSPVGRRYKPIPTIYRRRHLP